MRLVPCDKVFIALTLWGIWWTEQWVSILENCRKTHRSCLALRKFEGLYQCHDSGGNQEWSITPKGQIKHYDLCLTAVKFVKGTPVIMKVCDDSENQMWKLREGGLLQHAKMNSCLDTRFVQDRGITAERCNSGIDSQRWRFVQKFGSS